jgi:flagellar hook-length control protein FliK
VAAGPSRADTDRLSSFDTGGAMLDRLRAAASTTAAGGAAAASNGAASALWPWPSTAAGPTGSSTAVPLAANAPSEWRDTLSQALGDRLQLSLKQGADQAVIRLDPPMLGRIDLSIRQDGATLSVHLSASNPEVLRQLQAMGDGLRQDLATRHAGDLTVTVASQPSGLNAEADARQRQPRQGDDAGEATPGRALAEAETPSSDEEAGTRSYASLTRSGGAA